MDDSPEIRDSLNVNTATSYKKRLRKLNRLNSRSTIHENSKWLKNTCLLLNGYAKKPPSGVSIRFFRGYTDIFSIALKVFFSLFDRYNVFTSNWLWIEICENVVLSKINITMTTINKKL